jgi:hypothetical protein
MTEYNVIDHTHTSNLPQLRFAKKDEKKTLAREFKITLKHKDGSKVEKTFQVQNKSRVHPLQLHPEIMQKMNYSLGDLFQISQGGQGPTWTPWWRQPTAYGDITPPARGIDRLKPGARALTDMVLPQDFADRYNHEFETFIHSVYRICEKDTALSFFMGTTVDRLKETHWFRRDVHFTKPVFEKGTRKQDYPLITYHEEYDGGTYYSTGYGMAIPFDKLFKNGNGVKGKYAIDKFLVEGFSAIALGFRDFFYILFFELVLDMQNQHMRYINREQLKYDSLDEFKQFDNEIWGILNPEDRLDQNHNIYPVEHLIAAIKDHIKEYNHNFGSAGNKVGIVLDDKILHHERYQKYNYKYSYVGPKEGTLRNTDNLDMGDDIWKSHEAVIFGLSRFKDQLRPKGVCPLKQTLKLGYYFQVPYYTEVIDRNRIGNYESKHHDVDAITTTKMPIKYDHIPFEKIINLISERLFRNVFRREVRTFGDILVNNFGDKTEGGEALDNYIKDVYDIVVQSQWTKISKKNEDYRHVIDNIRFAISEKSHVISQPANGTKKPLSFLSGVKNVMILIGKIIKFFEEFGITIDLGLTGNDLILKIFLHIILDEEEIGQIITNPSFVQVKANYPVVRNLYDQLLNIYTPQKVAGLAAFRSIRIENEGDFKDYFKGDANSLKSLFKTSFMSIPADKINVAMLKKFIKWNIPMFFKIVLLRFEYLGSWAALFGTEKMAQKLDLQPTVTSTFQPRLLEAQLQFKDNCAIRLLRKQDIYVAENVKLDLGNPVRRLHCNLPDETDEFFKVMIFNHKSKIENINKLFFRNVDKNLENYLTQEAFTELTDTHDFQEIREHKRLEEFIDDDFSHTYNQHQYYIKDKFVKCCSYAYRGGIKKYNPNTGKWDRVEEVTGPMGKFYHDRK